jgi:hypothetical protein
VAVISVRPPNSLIIVGDPAADLPETMGGGLISSSSSAVAVGTRAEVDGETRIILAEAGLTRTPGRKRVFVGELALPSSRLTVESVLGDGCFERAMPEGKAQLEVWVNDETEPDEIVLVLR